MDRILGLYLLFILLYRVLELIFMGGRRSFLGATTKDKTYYGIILAFTLAITMPAIEYTKFRHNPGPAFMGLGIVLFILAVTIRVKGLRDLGDAFSPYIEKQPHQKLVTTGIYATIRHPLYLAVFLLALGCTVFFKSPTGWLYVVMTFGAIMGRIKREEVFLVANFSEYDDYRERTWRLFPYVL